jgi:hypothetical protein
MTRHPRLSLWEFTKQSARHATREFFEPLLPRTHKRSAPRTNADGAQTKQEARAAAETILYSSITRSPNSAEPASPPNPSTEMSISHRLEGIDEEYAGLPDPLSQHRAAD